MSYLAECTRFFHARQVVKASMDQVRLFGTSWAIPAFFCIHLRLYKKNLRMCIVVQMISAYDHLIAIIENENRLYDLAEIIRYRRG